MKWTAEKNDRRYALIIRKYSDAGLLPAEVDELALLQAELVDHRQHVAPLPVGEVKRYLKQVRQWQHINET